MEASCLLIHAEASHSLTGDGAEAWCLLIYEETSRHSSLIHNMCAAYKIAILSSVTWR